MKKTISEPKVAVQCDHCSKEEMMDGLSVPIGWICFFNEEHDPLVRRNENGAFRTLLNNNQTFCSSFCLMQYLNRMVKD
ncbi:MAG: hypothetical protein Q8K86_07045 [Candidatus Nanopelagicaceae bacterium]|nr:hypothetical protein [Candidatus Nanopelagicaceae bacterium]